MQKSALIELGEDGDNIVVIDRTARHDITDFFRGFLACKRLRSEGEMTKAVEDVVVEVVKRYQDKLPAEITHHNRNRYYSSVQARDTFKPDEFFAEYFGARGTEEVRATFKKLLERQGIEGEEFKFDKTAVRLQRPQKYKTAEGVKIEIPEQASETVKTESTDGGFTVMTIRTRKLITQ